MQTLAGARRNFWPRRTGRQFGGGGGGEVHVSKLVGAKSKHFFLPAIFTIHNSAPTGADAWLAEIGGQRADRQSQQPAQERSRTSQKFLAEPRIDDDAGLCWAADPQAVRDGLDAKFAHTVTPHGGIKAALLGLHCCQRAQGRRRCWALPTLVLVDHSVGTQRNSVRSTPANSETQPRPPPSAIFTQNAPRPQPRNNCIHRIFSITFLSHSLLSPSIVVAIPSFCVHPVILLLQRSFPLRSLHPQIKADPSPPR
ncbi:hypothetical protein VTN00DRAFT_7065 [Thermoascus crustaceus]|uniref:uncharacterized protein n=1 Tax=Thermoascus crustaceus TaxID=5088 RepID=UPI0037425792